MRAMTIIVTLLSLLILENLPIFFAFDYFKLSLHWPPSTNFRNQPINTPIPINFTIHGLSPHDIATSAPLQCPVPLSYGPVPPGDLLSRLLTKWPDLKNGNPQVFWKQEWDKHGGCSEPDYNQMAYLTLAMDLKDRYDILAALNAQGIVQAAPYSSGKRYTDYEQAILAHTGKLPELACKWGTVTPTWNLWEVRICFDYAYPAQALVIRDCPANPNYHACSNLPKAIVHLP